MLIANRKNSPLEQRQRLSRSMIWQLQRNFFDRQGIEAWRADGVPYHITSNPFIADAYAGIVICFFRDCQRAPGRTRLGTAALYCRARLGAWPVRFSLSEA